MLKEKSTRIVDFMLMIDEPDWKKMRHCEERSNLYAVQSEWNKFNLNAADLLT